MRTLRTVAVGLALASSAAACTSSGPDAPTSPPPGIVGTGSVTGTGSTALLPTSATALPTFDLARFQQLLGQLRGTPVLVNIWASWCGPCIAEAPGLEQLARDFQGRVQFVGVDLQDQTGPARTFIHRYGWTFPSVADPTGAIRNGLGFVGQPITLIYDRTGKRVFIWPGPITADRIRTELNKVV